MANVAVVVDSVACLTPELIEKYKVTITPLKFYFGDKIYRDGVDITLSEAYEIFLKDPGAFRTSAISPGEYMQAFSHASKHADKILCITLSNKISGCYSAARDARELFKKESPKVSIEVFDSQQVSVAEGLVALAAAHAAGDGKSPAEVLRAAKEISGKVKFVIFLDTIRYVYRSGRIPKIASQAGSILNVRPVLTMSDGALRFIGVARHKKSGMEMLLKKMREHAGLSRVHVAVTHAYAPEDAESLKEQIANEFNCSELWVSEFSPLMGYAVGTGAVGIAFYVEE